MYGPLPSASESHAGTQGTLQASTEFRVGEATRRTERGEENELTLQLRVLDENASSPIKICEAESADD